MYLSPESEPEVNHEIHDRDWMVIGNIHAHHMTQYSAIEMKSNLCR